MDHLTIFINGGLNNSYTGSWLQINIFCNLSLELRSYDLARVIMWSNYGLEGSVAWGNGLVDKTLL